MPENRRQWVFRSASRLAAVGVGDGAVAAARADESQENATRTPPDGKAWRIGVISARRQGKPQRINGRTWHFAQYLRISHYHYEMFNMARAFREMIRTRVEPTSHESILDVTAMIYLGAKSLQETRRLLPLAERGSGLTTVNV